MRAEAKTIPIPQPPQPPVMEERILIELNVMEARVICDQLSWLLDDLEAFGYTFASRKYAVKDLREALRDILHPKVTP